MGLSHTLNFILRHPLNRRNPIRALGRFVRWQITARWNAGPVQFSWVNASKIMAWKGLTGVTGNIYCGLHEYEDMAFVLHFLRPGDLFIDVGANVGSYTILGGTTGARVKAVEPIPDTFRTLQQNIDINQFVQRVEALNIGLGERAGNLFFTNHLDTVNHVVPAGTPDAQLVEVRTLDHLCAGDPPALIKMDVEGYEREVLKGAFETLLQPSLKAVIVELNDASRRYGSSESDVAGQLTEAGFIRVRYDPARRLLAPGDTPSPTGNGLFVRDVEFVRDRLLTSQQYRVNGIRL